MNPVKIKEILNSGEPDCDLDFQMLEIGRAHV